MFPNINRPPQMPAHAPEIKQPRLSNTDKESTSEQPENKSSVLPGGTFSRAKAALIFFRDSALFSLTGNTSLHQAAQEGDLDALKSLLGKHVNPGMTNKIGQTPLDCAVANGHFEIVNELLAHPNVKPNSADTNGRTPLSHAVENGHFEIVKKLLDNSNVRPDSANNKGRTPISYAAEKGRFDLIDLLQEAGANPNLPDENSLTPIAYAAQNGHRKAIEILLNNEKTLPNQKGKDGKTALHHAVENQHIEAIKFFLCNKDVDINLADQKGDTPLHYAVKNEDLEIIKLLLEQSDRINPNLQNFEGLTPFALAAQKNIVSTLEILLDNKDVDINREDQKGNTPLHHAVQNNCLDATKLLLKQHGRINPNLRNSEGLTPFALAAQKNITSALTVLLRDESIDVDMQNHEGETPFFLSAKNYTMQPSELEDFCFYKLLGRNRPLFGRDVFEKVRADSHRPRNDGMTPFQYLREAVRDGTNPTFYGEPSRHTRTAINFLGGMIANEHIRKDMPRAEIDLALNAIKEKSQTFYEVTLYQGDLGSEYGSQ